MFCHKYSISHGLCQQTIHTAPSNKNPCRLSFAVSEIRDRMHNLRQRTESAPNEQQKKQMTIHLHVKWNRYDPNWNVFVASQMNDHVKYSMWKMLNHLDEQYQFTANVIIVQWHLDDGLQPWLDAFISSYISKWHKICNGMFLVGILQLKSKPKSFFGLVTFCILPCHSDIHSDDSREIHRKPICMNIDDFILQHNNVTFLFNFSCSQWYKISIEIQKFIWLSCTFAKLEHYQQIKSEKPLEFHK